MSAARRRRPPARRRRSRWTWKHRLLIAAAAIALSGMLVGALLLRIGRPAAQGPYRFPTAAAAAATPTAEIEASDRARLQSLLQSLHETPRREPNSRR